MSDKKALELADALADILGHKMAFKEGCKCRACQSARNALAAYRAEHEEPAQSWDVWAVVDKLGNLICIDKCQTPMVLSGESIIPVRVTERRRLKERGWI